jgi:two-component system, OmpR family, sensor histidine kinase KdpD
VSLWLIKMRFMRNFARQNWIGYLAAIGGVAFVVIFYKLIVTGLNATTVALSLLLVVLIASSLRGLGPGVVAAVAGMLAFNFFFLPPTGTFTIEDPQNWVAITAFLVTAIITSQLSSAARSRAYEAERSREEVWRLYQLGRAIIAAPDFETATSSIARQVLDVFDLEYCAISVRDESGKLHRMVEAGRSMPKVLSIPVEESIQTVFRTGDLKIENTGLGEIVSYVPLKVGVKSTGVMVLISDRSEPGVVEAIAGLVALALERARFLQEVSRTEALRQSDELKSALLASVSHNLRTPLTSIRTSIDSLLREDFNWDKDALREFHLIISEETYRLTRLVENLLEMARIEAGELHPLKQWSSLQEITDNALERYSAVMHDHKVIIDLDESLPSVRVDSRLLAEVLKNLLENAAKYSPGGTEITVSGRIEGEELIISVSDQGSGIATDDLDRIFDKFYRAEQPSNRHIQGTGMGLAIARGIIKAHGGKIWAESAPERGSTFTFAIPVEYKNIKELIPADGEL